MAENTNKNCSSIIPLAPHHQELMRGLNALIEEGRVQQERYAHVVAVARGELAVQFRAALTGLLAERAGFPENRQYRIEPDGSAISLIGPMPVDHEKGGV